MVRRTIVFTALALFAAGAAHAQPAGSQPLDPLPGNDGAYVVQQQGAPAYQGAQQGYGARQSPGEELDPDDNPYADPAAAGTYDPSTRSITRPTPLTGPGGAPSYGAPPPADPPRSYGQQPTYGNPPPPPGSAAPPVYGPDGQAGVGTACGDIEAQLQRFRGPPSNPMLPRDEACASFRGAPGQPNTAFRQCSDRFFQQYEEMRAEYTRCLEQQASSGNQRLEDRNITADAARSGYGGTAPQLAGPYARSGAPGWLGVQVAPVSPQAAYRTGSGSIQGAYVLNAVMNSPAQRAGLRRGDIIIAFDGETIDDPKDLQYHAERLSAGQQVRLDILRAGQRQTLDVQITGRP